MKNKLELTWYNKYKLDNIEPRILIENNKISNTEKDIDTKNILIHGDNLLALKALEEKYTGKIKCIYIDPPYNTGNAFENYDDNIEHSIWLSLMYQRLKILYKLLSEEGTIWISIDDIESHYLKVMLDEIFGRKNFLGDIAYERSGTAGIGQGGTFLVNTRESILVYAKNKTSMKITEAKVFKPLDKEVMKRYSSILENEGERIEFARFKDSNGKDVVIYKHINYEIKSISIKNFEKRKDEIYKEYYDNYEKIYRTTNPQKENTFQQKIISMFDSRELYSVDYVPSRGKFKGKPTTLYYNNKELFAWLKASAEKKDNSIVKTNKMSDFWRNDDIPKANLANEGGVEFKRSKKPEALIKQILDIATDENDLVLDSFLGSGTTCAVAHKMKRNWIGVEMGEHIYTHCIPRLNSIINGKDLLGVTKQCDWKGGGGYKFYELAPSLINIDSFGEPVINKEYNAEMLASAVALHEGFKYNPSNEQFWKQSVGNENSYLYVTTKFVNKNDTNKIKEEMKENEYLVIACTSYDKEIDGLYKNIKIKKIPEMLLSKCEFGKDNYNLNIINPPEYEEEFEEDE